MRMNTPAVVNPRVRVIPAKVETNSDGGNPEGQKKKIAVYARVSTFEEDIRLSVAPPWYTNYCPLLSTLVVVGHIGGFGIIHRDLSRAVIIYINLFFTTILGIAKIVIVFLAPIESWGSHSNAPPASKGGPDS
jgi:hypothetical protein